eukprot:m.2678 g.2678  ORF g.2678 m.2678 type:complete len:911 (+) comp8842_c0_seq1:206-2938(+)
MDGKVITLIVCFFALSTARLQHENGNSLSLRCVKNEVRTYEIVLKQRFWANEMADDFTLTAKADLTCVAEGFLSRFEKQGMKFRAEVYDLEVKRKDDEVVGKAQEADPNRSWIRFQTNKRFGKPFYFIQLTNGTIAHVLHSKDDDRQVLSFKRALAGAFQVSLTKGKSHVEEITSNNKHRAHYVVEEDDDGHVKVHKEYSSSDIRRFSKGYNVKPSQTEYDEYEDVEIDDGVANKLTGELHAKLFSDKEDNGEIARLLTSDQQYSIKLIRRQKMRLTKRSSTFTMVDDTEGLEIASIESEMTLVDSIEEERESLKYQTPLLLKLAEDLQRAGGKKEQYSQLAALLRVEGLCEYHQCPSGTETPLSDRIIQQFKKTDLPQLRRDLLPFLVESSSKLSQQLLGKALSHPEQYGLTVTDVLSSLHYVEHASVQLVDDVINVIDKRIPDVRAGALLALGALAQKAEGQSTKSIVKYLATTLRTTANEQSSKMVPILFALGNTQDENAIEPILRLIQHSSISNAVRRAACVALNHLAEAHQDAVDEALINLIKLSPFNGTHQLAHTIMEVLYGRQRSKVNQHSQLEAAVSARSSNDESLAELYDTYLISNKRRRVRRASSHSSIDWADDYRGYNKIDSHENRMADKNRFSKAHRAYLYENTFGEDILNLNVAAGAFAGLEYEETLEVKIFGKAVGSLHAFGKDFTLLNALFLIDDDGRSLTFTRYLRIGPFTLVPYQTDVANLCFSLRNNTVLKKRTLKVFTFSIKYPLIWGLVLNFRIEGNISLEATAGFEVCPLSSPLATAFFKPKTELTLRGTASGSLAGIVEGGIDLSASISFYVKPEIQFKRRLKTTISCLNFWAGVESIKITFETFYKTLTLKWSWPYIQPGGKKILTTSKKNFDYPDPSNLGGKCIMQ